MNKDLFIIGLSALPAGGKDFIGDILHKKFGFYKISPGDIVREITKKELGSKKISREDQQKIQEKYRRKYGKNYIMELCYKKILKRKVKRAVISGIRFPNDIKFFKSKLGDKFINIFVYAPRKLRYQRTIERKREDMPKSYTEFVKQDKLEEKIFHLKQTKELSDFIIYNDKSAEETEKQLDKILKTINLYQPKKHS